MGYDAPMAAQLDFFTLIDRSLTDPRIEAVLHQRYGASLSVLVVDFSGMTRRSAAAGIVHALAMARAGAAVIASAARAHGGQRLKQIADTFFFTFPAPLPALLAALDGQRAMIAFRQGQPDPLHACMGLGHGPCLLLPEEEPSGRDIFGSEVNRAFLLGEDTARADEVLASPDFVRALQAPPLGVGISAASHDRAHRVGFHFHSIADYRTPST